jgi:hypothetical protein
VLEALAEGHVAGDSHDRTNLRVLIAHRHQPRLEPELSIRRVESPLGQLPLPGGEDRRQLAPHVSCRLRREHLLEPFTHDVGACRAEALRADVVRVLDAGALIHDENGIVSGLGERSIPPFALAQRGFDVHARGHVALHGKEADDLAVFVDDGVCRRLDVQQRPLLRSVDEFVLHDMVALERLPERRIVVWRRGAAFQQPRRGAADDLGRLVAVDAFEFGIHVGEPAARIGREHDFPGGFDGQPEPAQFLLIERL